MAPPRSRCITNGVVIYVPTIQLLLHDRITPSISPPLAPRRSFRSSEIVHIFFLLRTGLLRVDSVHVLFLRLQYMKQHVPVAMRLIYYPCSVYLYC